MSQHESEAEERLRQELRQYLAGLAEQASLAPEMRERIRTIPMRHSLNTQGERQTHPIESKDQQRNRSRQSGRRADIDIHRHSPRVRRAFWALRRQDESRVSEQLLSAFLKRLVAYCSNELGDATLAEEVAQLAGRQGQKWRVDIAEGRKPAQLSDLECWLLMYAYDDWLLLYAHVACTRLKGKAGAHLFSERAGAPSRDRDEEDSTHQLPGKLIAHISDRLTAEENTFIQAMSHRETDKTMPEVQAMLLGVSVTTIQQRVSQLRRKIRAIRDALQQCSPDEE